MSQNNYETLLILVKVALIIILHFIFLIATLNLIYNQININKLSHNLYCLINLTKAQFYF